MMVICKFWGEILYFAFLGTYTSLVVQTCTNALIKPFFASFPPGVFDIVMLDQ